MCRRFIQLCIPVDFGGTSIKQRGGRDLIKGTEDPCIPTRISRFDRTTIGGDWPSRAIRTPRALQGDEARRPFWDQVDPLQ
jgi:hypothetical protein